MKNTSIAMDYSQVVNYLRGLIKEDMPDSVFDDFIKSIYVPNIDNYLVSNQGGNGNIKISHLTPGDVEISYIITVDNDKVNYKIDGYRKQFDGFNVRAYDKDSVELQHDIANNYQWKLSKSRSHTVSSTVKDRQFDLDDRKEDSVTSYDLNGVATLSQEEILTYPKRVNQKEFTVGLLLRPSKRIVNNRYRTSLQTVRNYQDEYDLNNNSHIKKDSFCILNSQHNLGGMNAVAGYVYNEDEFNAQVDYDMNLSEEELQKILSNTPSLEMDGLIEQYYPHFSKENRRKL